MDPRQPQHPFARNTASPYGRTPFPPTSNQVPFPPQPAPSYAERQRRPSDPPFFNQQRSYAPEPMPQGHTRHQSASSIGAPANRSMPPPSSPQQQIPHPYGLPRAAPAPGPPSLFTSRELPTLPPLGRGNGSSMSISSMLGGAREPASYHGSPIVTTAPPAMFGPAHASPRVHASPRISTSVADYPPYRRPQTPEHPRYEPRDQGANSAGSPIGTGQYGTPDGRRFGTPQQGYVQRAPADERREPMRIPNPNAQPTRPNSQPAFNNPPPPPPPPRVAERHPHNEPLFGRRMDGRNPEVQRMEGRPEVRPEGYGRPAFEERHDPYAYAERIRLERDATIQREAEEAAIRQQRERAREHDNNIYAQQLAQRNAQNAYNRGEPRDQTAWARPGYEPDRRYEPAPSERPAPPTTSGYEYPAATTASHFNRIASYHPTEHRYGQPPQNVPLATAQQQAYEREAMDRQRLIQQEEQRLRQQQQHALEQQRQEQQPYQNQQYQHESPQRRSAIEESQPMQPSRSFLGVQEMNRKGRNSPLPQAVQGAQGQLNAPGGEPSIKNEFGRMFSGIGMGVPGLGVPSPVSANAGMPFSTSGQLRRDDLDNLQESPIENGKVGTSASRQGGGRRRKLKEEDSRDDDSTGRRTPSGSGRGKRTKTTHHHAPHHHHHHRPDNDTSPTNMVPFSKSGKGAIIQSPNLHHHHVPRHHHHHHHVNAKPSAPVNIIVPLIKPRVLNQTVLDQIKGRTRFNLGSTYYQSDLRPGGPNLYSKLSKKPSKHIGGFTSTPKPLPRFEGKENSIFTVKVPQVYLGEISRREITKRRAVWGTDIYTDDSDVIAACIHQGWFRGAWNDDVDVGLLDLELEVDEPQAPFSIDDVMTRPPPTGPIHVPHGYDCHVTIIVMPQLQKYGSLTRFGLRSREWGFQRDGYSSIHDGVSFMIHSIEWVRGVDEQEGRNRASRSKIFAKQLDNRELEQESAWDELFHRSNGATDYEARESFERGPRPGDIQDTRPWITGINKPEVKGKEKEASPMPSLSPTPEMELEVEPEVERKVQVQTQRILGPLPPPIPSPLSSPIMAPEPLDEEEVTPNMAALLASSLEAERAFVRPVGMGVGGEHERMSSSQEMRIERVTERMIENANLLEEPLPVHEPTLSELPQEPTRLVSLDVTRERVGSGHGGGSENRIEVLMEAHHRLERAAAYDPIAALADIAVANAREEEQAEAAAKAAIKEEPVERTVQEILGTPSIFG